MTFLTEIKTKKLHEIKLVLQRMGNGNFAF